MLCNVTLFLKRKLQHVGHKWIVCGSHLDCSVGQWVKLVNRYDPLLTLVVLICMKTASLNISGGAKFKGAGFVTD